MSIIKYQDRSSGIILPRIHHIGYTKQPSAKDLDAYLTGNGLDQESLKRSLTSPSFSSSGIIQKPLSQISVKKSLGYLTHCLNIEDGFEMPNLGKFLAGNLDNKSVYLNMSNDINSKSLVNISDGFDICILKFDGNKGYAAVFERFTCDIVEKLRFTRSVPRKNLGNSIKVKEKSLVINTLLNGYEYFLENDRLKNTGATLRKDENNDFGLQIPLREYTFRQWNNLLLKMKNSKNISEKVYDSIKDHATIEDVIFVPNVYFSISYINIMFALLLKEVSYRLRSIANINILEMQYFICEYYLNKIYFALKNDEPLFGVDDIFLNKVNKNNFSTFTNLQERLTKTNEFIKDNVLRVLKYNSYTEEGRKLSLEYDSNYVNQVKPIYNLLSDNFANFYLSNIFYHTKYIRNIEDIASQSVNDNKGNVFINEKLFDLSIDPYLFVK